MTTALVPWDASVIDLCNQLRAPVDPKSPLQLAIDSVIRLVEDMTLEAAINMLYSLGGTNEELYSHTTRLKVTTLLDVDKYPEYEGRAAKEIGPFYFWGGPPRGLRYYSGTLLDLLLDRIFCMILTEGTTALTDATGLIVKSAYAPAN